MRKGGMRPGDAVLITKAVGTGVLLAADMRGMADGDWVRAALESMQVSSRRAAQILRRHGATSCTDVTGFGVVGHLLEMARASEVSVELRMRAVPLLAGAAECVRRGIFSSLQPQNLRLARAVRWDAVQEDRHAHPTYPLIFDPQTAGGLLASVPAASAAACLEELRAAGYGQSAAIGEVVRRDELACSSEIVCL